MWQLDSISICAAVVRLDPAFYLVQLKIKSLERKSSYVEYTTYVIIDTMFARCFIPITWANDRWHDDNQQIYLLISCDKQMLILREIFLFFWHNNLIRFYVAF